MSVISDGQGTGNKAKVTSGGQLSIVGAVRSSSEQEAIDGDLFFYNTPIITLTSASASAIFLIKNNAEEDLFLVETIVSIGNSVGGSGGAIILGGVRNAVDSTVESLGGAGGNTSQNFGSSATLDVTTLFGAEGAAVTAVVTSGVFVPELVRFNTIASRIVLEQGNSYAILVTPPAGNTSLPVTVRSIFSRVGVSA